MRVTWSGNRVSSLRVVAPLPAIASRPEKKPVRSTNGASLVN
uniref:Uncharacterized protein n=1 Tax=Triticum urartu TaxID=4572 RepID=A0A8R7NXT1_TRIUA